MAQTKQERHALNMAWRNDPKVIAFTEAVRERARNAPTTEAAVTSVLQFAAAWIDTHGPLPDSGITCD